MIDRMQETRSTPGMEVRTDSHKVRVEVGPDRVVKHFKPATGARRRFQCEVRALQCLSGIEGFPALLEFSPAHSTLAVERVEGRPLLECEAPPDSVFTSLRVLVERMLERGVARHSLPPRDIIVRPDGHATLVDFERVTFRWCPWGPWWLSAAAITRFHLIRLLAEGAPHLLTPAERRRLKMQFWVRNAFRPIIESRKRWRGRVSKQRW